MDAKNIKIKSIVLELRFDPVVFYQELRKPLFEQWFSKGSDISVSQASIEMKDLQAKYKYAVEWAQASVMFEDVQNLADFTKDSIPFLEKTLDTFKRNELRRIGNRYMFLLPYEGSFEQLTKSLKVAIYTPLINVWSEIIDIGQHALTLKDGNNKVNVAFGPVRKREIDPRTLFAIEDNPQTALMFDIDYYCDIKLSYDLKRFVELAHRFSFDSITNFIKGIKED